MPIADKRDRPRQCKANELVSLCSFWLVTWQTMCNSTLQRIPIQIQSCDPDGKPAIIMLINDTENRLSHIPCHRLTRLKPIRSTEDKSFTFEHLHTFCSSMDYDTERTKICQDLSLSVHFIMVWIANAWWKFQTATIDEHLKYDCSELRHNPNNVNFRSQLASVITFHTQVLRIILSFKFSDMTNPFNQLQNLFPKVSQSLGFIFRQLQIFPKSLKTRMRINCISTIGYPFHIIEENLWVYIASPSLAI